MNETTKSSILPRLLHEKKIRKYMFLVLLILALAAFLTTTAILSQNAETMTKQAAVLDCHYHVQTGEGYAGYVVHVHNEDCYDAEGKLVCELPEIPAHVHDESCWRTEEVLVCGLEECEEHHHDESCYETVTELICGQQELHTHTPDCYDETGALICGLLQLEEHVHGQGCFIQVEDGEESDPSADVESYEDYAVLFESMDKTGPWNELLVAVAKTQLGYTESVRNFVTVNGEHRGYTRYGDWYGQPYGDWSATFVSFCLHFAEIPMDAMPAGSDVTAWIDTLQENDLYAEAAGYTPRTGDLIFFDLDRDAQGDHVGIVTAVDEGSGTIMTIEGDRTTTVEQFSYAWNDPAILGYGLLPERPAVPVDEESADAVLALITAADGSPLPENVQPYAYALDGEEAESAQHAVEAFLTAPVSSDLQGSIRSLTAAPAAMNTETNDASGMRSETRYEVFEIGLDHVEETALEGGFRVSVTLPTALTGRDFALYHLAGDGVEALEAEYDSVINGDGTETVTGFHFVTDSFSPFVLRFTVDFHYEERTASLEGRGETTLSALFEALGIKKSLSDVTAVSFSDPSLLEVRYDEGIGDWILRSLLPFDTEESLTVRFTDGSALCLLVTDFQLHQILISDSGELFEITVTYDETAQLPEGAVLRVREFDEQSEEYARAREAVLARIYENDEDPDLSDFGLAALDISILTPEGEELEPASSVQVELRVKSLPGVKELENIASTLEVQHHTETEDGVTVETVSMGSTDAVFEIDLSEQPAPEEPEAAVLLSFETSSFSTFSVTWGSSAATDTTANYRWRSGSGGGGGGGGATTYGQVTFHYVDQNGNAITRPSGIDNNTNDRSHTGNNVDYSVNIEDTFGLAISGYTYQGAYYNSATGTEVTSVQLYRSGSGTRYIRLNHGDTQVYALTASGSSGGGPGGGSTPTVNVYLVYSGSSGNTATIHYVDEDGNELTVSNGQPVSDTNNSNYNYLIYDVDGYEYAYTYRNTDTNANRITPVLRYNSNRWQYTTSTNENSASWSNLDSDDDIYVVYRPKAAASEGGTPVPKITGEKPEAPTITKDSTVNGDGTNTLTLSVTGHTSVMEAEKLADVIVIFDVSGSMNYEMGSDTAASAGQRRMDYAQAATKALAEALLGKNTDAHPELIRMSLIYFSNTATKVELSDGTEKYFTTDKTAFKDAVDDLPSPGGGTNWEYALQLANEMAVESDRATFVIFVTDGDPTFRKTRGTLHNSSTDNGLGSSYRPDGGQWQRDVTDYYFQYQVYGGGNNDRWNRNFDAALVQAQSIVSHNKNFYTIGISNDVTNLTSLTTQAGAGADHSKTATSNDELVAAFDDVAASIIALMGYSDVQITDGITALTQTVQKSDLVSFAEDDFTYTKERLATAEEISDPSTIPTGSTLVNRDGTYYVVWNNWDPTSEGCAAAVYEDGAVKWNMGESFMLEDGYTYRVYFKVWPSQEAYDLLADLNNGKKTYASLSDAEKAQIAEPATEGGAYTLKTNSNTSYTYKEATKAGDTVTTTGEASEPGHFPDVTPLELTTKALKVRKQWHNNYSASREPLESITMQLYSVNADGSIGSDFKTITLTAPDWYAEDNYISYGLVTYDTSTNEDARIYEAGHDFTLRETDDEAHYYELTAGVYRAMYINGTPTILQRLDAAPTGMGDSVFHYNDGTSDYYRLDGHVYLDTGSDVLLIATNSRRSYMDLVKAVVDESGAATVDDAEFEYQITITVPAGIANYDDVEKYIWFSIRDNNAGRTLSPDEYTYTGAQKPADIDSAYGGSAYANYLVATSGEQFTLKIKQGWSVRFLNLPNGTTYSFEEVNVPTGYDFVSAVVSGTRWIANMVDGEDHGAAVAMSGLPSNTSADSSDTGISGTIDYANARYRTTYTNRTVTTPVKILKTNQDGTTPLSGAEFVLYTESGYAADPKLAAQTGLVSDADGMIDLGKLSFGKYYLVETVAPAGYNLLTDPVVITVADTGVTYNQSDSALSVGGSGVSYDAATETYTLTVTNNIGYELPNTGGPGVHRICLLGLALIVVPCAGWMLRRKRKTE